MKKFIVAFGACAFLMINYSFAQKPVELKFNLKKGESYDYNLNMAIETKGNINGQDIDVNNAIGIGYNFKNTGDSAGWKKIASTITRIAMDLNVSGLTISYDSDKPLDSTDMIASTIGKVLGAMKGGVFAFTMNETGKVGSVTGFEEMMNKVSSAAAGAGPMGSVTNAFNEDNFKQNLEQSFGAYPGKPVKPGDTWTSTMHSNSGGMEMIMDNVYTLESVQGNTATVKTNSSISSPAADSTASIKGTSTGTVKYDIPSGIAIDGDVETKLDMDITRDGMEIPMTTEIKTKITGKKG